MALMLVIVKISDHKPNMFVHVCICACYYHWNLRANDVTNLKSCLFLSILVY